MNIKKIKYSIFFLMPFFFFACKSADESLANYLIGNWEVSFIRVTMPTFQGGNREKVVDVDFQNPKDATKTAKRFYIFSEDNTFETWTQDAVGRTRALKGEWSVKDGHLEFNFLDNTGRQVILYFAVQKNIHGFSMEQLQDRDGDGKKDDTYFVETNRLAQDAFSK